jgi:hypothetical protein
MKMISQLRGYLFMCIHQDTSLSFTIAVIIIDTETCGVFFFIYIYIYIYIIFNIKITKKTLK